MFASSSHTHSETEEVLQVLSLGPEDTNCHTPRAFLDSSPSRMSTHFWYCPLASPATPPPYPDGSDPASPWPSRLTENLHLFSHAPVYAESISS